MMKFRNCFIAVALIFSVTVFANEQNQSSSEEQKSTKNTEQVEKKSDSILQSVTNAVSNTIDSAVKLVNLDKLTSVGEEGIPRKVAILPATGEGDAAEQEDVRLAIHNHFSSKNFDLIKPDQVNQKLQLLNLESSLSDIVIAQNPDVIAKQLGADGLIYVDLTEVSKVYAAAYAHYELSVQLRFYDAQKKKFFWTKEESIAEREGGISLNPLSFIATAISSATVLTEAARQSLVDQLARRFAKLIPFPKGTIRKIKPPSINMAISNAVEGPFKAGEEVTVFMRGESGLTATFDIGQMITGNILEEKSRGEYVGRYVVPNDANYQDLAIKIHAARVADGASILWSVPGHITLDTTPPEAIKRLVAKPVNGAIKLTWDIPASSTEQVSYVIEKADATTGKYQTVTSVEINEYRDQEVSSGEQYHYRIVVQDLAGNKSPFTLTKAMAINTGPTPITTDITENTKFYAIASPYQIQNNINVLRNAKLTLEPGVVIEFSANSSLSVMGKLAGQATESAPIVFKGENWQLNFVDNGKNASELDYFRAQGGKIATSNSELRLGHCQLKQANVAVEATNNSYLVLHDCDLSDNQQAISWRDSKISLHKVNLTNNKIALVSSRGEIDSMMAVNFDSNKSVIDTNDKLLLSQVSFKGLTYDELMAQLPKSVHIDWKNVAPEQNIQHQWLKSEWPALLHKGKNSPQNWQNTYQQVSQLLAKAPNAPSLLAYRDVLSAYLKLKTNISDKSALAVKQFLYNKTSDNGQLWVQQLKVPHLKNTVISDSFILNKAKKKLETDYLKQFYPNLSSADIRKYKRQLKLKNAIVSSRVLYRYRQGMFDYIAVSHFFDYDKVKRQLSVAGIIRAQQSEMLVGILNNASAFALSESISESLSAQGIQFISLGNGSYGKPALAKAKRLGADVILATDLLVNNTSSNLSKNLKMIDVNLNIAIYDVYTQESLRRLSSMANSAGFNQQQAVTKALAKAYKKIKEPLLEQLWNADAIVKVHHKEQKQKQQALLLAKKRAEQEKARKLKEQKEREKKARIAAQKAEAERLAQLNKLKAEQLRLEQEKAKLAKMTAELKKQSIKSTNSKSKLKNAITSKFKDEQINPNAAIPTNETLNKSTKDKIDALM